MLIPPKGCPSTIETDIAVIGAGPVGMALGLDLAKAGRDVAVLSSGEAGRDQLSAGLSQAEMLPRGHADPAELGARRFGGLSWSWGGRCVAFDPVDFIPRDDLGLPGWPVSEAVLTARKNEAADFLGVGPPDFAADWPGDAPAGLAVHLERWCETPRLVHRHRASFAARHAPRVYLGVTCVGASVDQDGRITGLDARKPDGEAVSVRAKRVVLAAGGIETARLLLWIFASNGRMAPDWTGRGYCGHLKGSIAALRFPDGDWQSWTYENRGGVYVRRRIGLAPEIMQRDALLNINMQIDNPPLANPAHGTGELSALALGLSLPVVGEALAGKAMRGYLLGGGLSGAALARHARNVAAHPLAAVGFAVKSLRARLSRPVLPGIHVVAADGWIPLTFYAEEVPRFSNGVTLSQTRDRFGMPKARIAREIGDEDIASIYRAHTHLSQAFSATKVACRVTPMDAALMDRIRKTSGDGYHQIGLARMAASSAEGVTDANGRVFGFENLFVAGSAVFPRSGQANPTYLAICQALLLAQHLSRA